MCKQLHYELICVYSFNSIHYNFVPLDEICRGKKIVTKKVRYGKLDDGNRSCRAYKSVSLTKREVESMFVFSIGVERSTLIVNPIQCLINSDIHAVTEIVILMYCTTLSEML